MSSPYPFDPSFERAVVGLLVTSDRFFGLVGTYIDPARFKDERAQILAAAARDLYERIGKPPGSMAVVMQALRAQHEAGKLKSTRMSACADYLCDGMDEGLPDVDVATAQVAEVLKRLEQTATLDEAFNAHAQHGDMTVVAKKLERIQSIGKSDASYGATLDDFGAELDIRGKADRMSTGFRELDVATMGGPERGEYVFWLAGQKVGKTMCLVQNAAIGMLRNMHVAVATLEVDPAKWRARVLGTVTGTPYQDILKYGSKSVAFERYKAMMDDPEFALGRLAVHRFGGHQTDVPTVLDWVKREEDRAGRKVEVLIVDYADKLIGAPGDGEYIQMRDVYERLRLYAVDQGIWVWSASQAQRIALGELPTANHCADSQHKIRVADGCLAVTKHPDEDNAVRAKIVAWRNGPGEGAETSKLPNGFDYGCFVRSAAVGVEVEEALVEGGESGLGIFA